MSETRRGQAVGTLRRDRPIGIWIGLTDLVQLPGTPL